MPTSSNINFIGQRECCFLFLPPNIVSQSFVAMDIREDVAVLCCGCSFSSEVLSLLSFASARSATKALASPALGHSAICILLPTVSNVRHTCFSPNAD